MTGLERLYHFEDLEKEPLLTRKHNYDNLPDHTIYYKDLERFSTETDILPLKKTNTEIFSDTLSNQKTVILVFDSTVRTAYGNQEGVAVGYNPHKPGRSSYHPLLVFERKSGYLINLKERPGNVHSEAGFKEFYSATAALLPKGVKVECCVLDKGLEGDDDLTFLADEAKTHYICKLRQYSWHGLIFESLNYRFLFEAADGVKVFAGELRCRFPSWQKVRRVVVIKKEAVIIFNSGGNY